METAEDPRWPGRVLLVPPMGLAAHVPDCQPVVLADEAQLSVVHDRFRDVRRFPRAHYCCETDGSNPYLGGRIVGHAFCFDGDPSLFYVPVRHRTGEPQHDPAVAARQIFQILSCRHVVGAGLKLDLAFLTTEWARDGYDVAGLGLPFTMEDLTYLAAAGGDHEPQGLDALARRVGYQWVDHAETYLSELGAWLTQAAKDQGLVPDADGRLWTEDGARFPTRDLDASYLPVGLAAERAGRDLLLIGCLAPGLRSWASPAAERDCQTAMLLLGAEAHGMLVDLPRAYQQSADLAGSVVAARILLGIDPMDDQAALGWAQQRDPNLKAVNRQALSRSHHPEIADLAAARHAGTLLRGLTTVLDHVAGDRIRPVYDRVSRRSRTDALATTGRLSCVEPNGQALDGDLRHLLVVPPGQIRLYADYSQVDLRGLAFYTQDPLLLGWLRSGVDVHTATAAEIFAVDPAAVTRDQRAAAKAINFGLAYGMTPWGLAEELRSVPAYADMSEDDRRAVAAQFQGRYWERLSTAREWIDRFVAGVRQAGGVFVSAKGRRRQITEPDDRKFARLAIASLIQGCTADVIKDAMIRVRARTDRQGVRAYLLGNWHDELQYDVARPQARDLMSILAHEMPADPLLSPVVPLPVVISWSDSTWAAKKVIDAPAPTVR